jgi:hypothetical protein
MTKLLARSGFFTHRARASGRSLFLEFHKGQYIEIFTNGKPRADQPADAIGYQHFCLIVDDIDETLKHLAAMNVQPSGRRARALALPHHIYLRPLTAT